MQSVKGKRNAVIEAYCFGCRTKTEIQNTKKVTLKNNRPAIEGTCLHCGTRMFKIVKQ
ncbi:DUF5679 domain-containing protein [Chloroflexota bacterium]